jgi:hypothetical protein
MAGGRQQSITTPQNSHPNPTRHPGAGRDPRKNPIVATSLPQRALVWIGLSRNVEIVLKNTKHKKNI